MGIRILYTKQGMTPADGGWYVDTDETDPSAAAWNLAVQVTAGDPERPAVLVAIQQT